MKKSSIHEKHEEELTKEEAVEIANTEAVVETIGAAPLLKSTLSKCDMYIFALLFLVAACLVYYFRYEFNF